MLYIENEFKFNLRLHKKNLETFIKMNHVLTIFFLVKYGYLGLQRGYLVMKQRVIIRLVTQDTLENKNNYIHRIRFIY
jgi:hypothetical protein